MLFKFKIFYSEKSHMAMVSKNKKCREGPSSFGIHEKSSAKSDHGLGSNFIGFLKYAQYNVEFSDVTARSQSTQSRIRYLTVGLSPVPVV